MNEHEAHRIASAVNRLRPDWPEQQLRTLITERLADRPRRDVAVALAWVACEAATQNPYRVLEGGPWWLAAAVDGQTTGRREPHDRSLACDICGRRETAHGPNAGHAFESVDAANRRRAAESPKPSLRELLPTPDTHPAPTGATEKETADG